jgi:penicillin-binding protein 1A
VIPDDVAQQVSSILQTVVTNGTGTAARIDEWAAGKTGTTENYGDAWFVGYTERYTTAVWVGYPDRLKPMQTEYRGQPVAGGTYPAEIWHDVMSAIGDINGQRELEARERKIRKLEEEGKPIPPELLQTTPTPTTPAPATPGTTPPATTQQAPETPETPEDDGGGTGGEAAPVPEQPAPAPDPAPTPAPSPTPTPTPAPDTGGAGAGAALAPPPPGR